MHRQSAVVVFVVAMLVLCGATSCKTVAKHEFRTVRVEKEIEITGYGWGENAEETAKNMAARLAIAAVKPGTLTFEYMHDKPFSMFTTSLGNSNVEVEMIGTEKLPDGGVKAVAKATRTQKVKKRMQNTRALVLSITSKKDTFEERVREIRELAYEQAVLRLGKEQFRVDKNEQLPEKMKGGLWIFSFDIEDDGSTSKGTLTAYAKVKKGSLDANEKARLLMNAWRNAILLAEMNEDEQEDMLDHLQGRMEDVTMEDLDYHAIFNKMLKLRLEPDYAAYFEEFAAFSLKQKEYNDAVRAMEKAVELAPFKLDYQKKLYQIVKKTNDRKKLEKWRTTLEQVEVFEDELGADLTGGMKYTRRYRWKDIEETDEAGVIRFKEAE